MTQKINMIELGDLIKSLRTQKGMTQDELAKKCHFGDGKSIRDIESGNRAGIDDETLNALAIALYPENPMAFFELLIRKKLPNVTDIPDAIRDPILKNIVMRLISDDAQDPVNYAVASLTGYLRNGTKAQQDNATILLDGIIAVLSSSQLSLYNDELFIFTTHLIRELHSLAQGVPAIEADANEAVQMLKEARQAINKEKWQAALFAAFYVITDWWDEICTCPASYNALSDITILLCNADDSPLRRTDLALAIFHYDQCSYIL